VSKTISLEELRERLDELTVIETLPPAAYRRRHLPGALNLPKSRAAALAPVLLPELDAEIVVYCGSRLCRSSDRVAESLRRLGYTRVRVYRGGKREWLHAGLPLEHVSA
jgi:rhodanese-related sulfurtransferase